MDHIDALARLASVIAGFSLTVFIFRLSRELHLKEAGEPTWIPWADRLVLTAFFICVLTLIALLLLPIPPPWRVIVVGAACVASLVLLAGYVPSICAHYRLWFGTRSTGERRNPEPAERFWVHATSIAAASAAVLYVLTRGSG